MAPVEAIVRVPVHAGADGVVRVSATRVTLETMIGALVAPKTLERAQELSQRANWFQLERFWSIFLN